MTIQDRLSESEQKYNNLQDQRNELVKQADDILTEMTKLQGEYRVLQDLLQEQEVSGDKTRVNKNKATTVEVVPEAETV